MKITYILNKEQERKLIAFEDKHKPTCNKPPIGGCITYLISPTSIGEIFKIRCECGVTEDLTDYSEF